MEFARYAKAFVALAMGMATLLAQFAASTGEPTVTTYIVGAGAIATALAVYLVPNKTHGFNALDIADQMIETANEFLEAEAGGDVDVG